MTARAFPPRWEHEEYDEDLYEWTHRYNPGAYPKEYSCKFCPGRDTSPEEIRHAPSCPAMSPECPECGSTNTVLVAEGNPPALNPHTADHVGCYDCQNMRPFTRGDEL